MWVWQYNMLSKTTLNSRGKSARAPVTRQKQNVWTVQGFERGGEERRCKGAVQRYVAREI